MKNKEPTVEKIKISYIATEDVHDGYCSDYENMEEHEDERFAWLPASDDITQHSKQRWSIDSFSHCCCGAQSSWRSIRVVED
jgi:hypothetical protein